MKKVLLALIIIQVHLLSWSQSLNIPDRNSNLPNGDGFVDIIVNLDLETREDTIFSHYIQGNIPDFMRNFVQIDISEVINTTTYNIEYFVLPDYLAIGCDTNYFLCPMTPVLAQRICNYSDCTLPTRKMVNEIYSASELKLSPSTMTPSAEMINVPYFDTHNQTVWSQRWDVINDHPLGELVGGHKKDVVISNEIYESGSEWVVIYGWHQLNGSPIQPLYNGHILTYADYSHGIRLISNSCIVNGVEMSIREILQDANLYSLFSDEDQIATPYYPVSETVPDKPISFAITQDNDANAVIQISDDLNAEFFILEISTDGQIFTVSDTITSGSTTLTNFQLNTPYFCKIKACNSEVCSEFSEVLGFKLSENLSQMLVINAFDRITTGNTYDFIIEHGNAIHENDYAFNSATDEAIRNSLLTLNDFERIDIIFGEESSNDVTFTEVDQDLYKSYLNNGGKLFISGSEIAWDLDHLGSYTDKSFFNEYLKAQYVYDAPMNQSSTHYEFEGITEPFAALPIMNFDDGTNGYYDVDYPDVIDPVNGSDQCFQYSSAGGQSAGICYTGLFPGGTSAGKLVYLGFPFETVYNEENRNQLMGAILEYFDTYVMLEDKNILSEISIFPNPCFDIINIHTSSSIDINSQIKIYDLQGHLLSTQKFKDQLDVSNLNPGLYFIQVKDSDSTKTVRFVKGN
jgi:hypothetical protein